MSVKVTNTDEPVKPITLTEKDRDLIAELVANEIKKELKELLNNINTDNKTKNKEPKKNNVSAKRLFIQRHGDEISNNWLLEREKLPSPPQRAAFMKKKYNDAWISLPEEKKKEYQMEADKINKSNNESNDTSKEDTKEKDTKEKDKKKKKKDKKGKMEDTPSISEPSVKSSPDPIIDTVYINKKKKKKKTKEGNGEDKKSVPEPKPESSTPDLTSDNEEEFKDVNESPKPDSDSDSNSDSNSDSDSD